MKIIGDIPHPVYKVTLYAWNNRYLLKIEHGMYEQTYKVDETEVDSAETFRHLLASDFGQKVRQVFISMQEAWEKGLDEAETA
jgi:hypothetical protein